MSRREVKEANNSGRGNTYTFARNLEAGYYSELGGWEGLADLKSGHYREWIGWDGYADWDDYYAARSAAEPLLYCPTTSDAVFSNLFRSEMPERRVLAADNPQNLGNLSKKISELNNAISHFAFYTEGLAKSRDLQIIEDASFDVKLDVEYIRGCIDRLSCCLAADAGEQQSFVESVEHHLNQQESKLQQLADNTHEAYDQLNDQTQDLLLSTSNATDALTELTNQLEDLTQALAPMQRAITNMNCRLAEQEYHYSVLADQIKSLSDIKAQLTSLENQTKESQTSAFWYFAIVAALGIAVWATVA